MLNPTTTPVIVKLGPDGILNISLDTVFVYSLSTGDKLTVHDGDGRSWVLRVNEKHYTVADRTSPVFVTIIATPV
jgi:hypothetical protein